MRYALFLGCTIPARLNQYERSARLVFERLGIETVDIPDFNCCGYPFRNYDNDSFVLSSARNLALASKTGLDIITLCKCCYGSLKKVETLLKEDPGLFDKVNLSLKKEGLAVDNNIGVKHYLQVFYHDVGIDFIKEKITKPYSGLKLAVHYGCHALRPANIVKFDDPNNPVIFDELVLATGAESVKWEKRLECCGAPQLGINDALSFDIMEKKIDDARRNSADYICSACPYCQVQFDRAQKMMMNERGKGGAVASVLYTQLLGLAMGIDGRELQIEKSELDISGIMKYI